MNMKMIKKRRLWILMLIRRDWEQGPDNDDERFHQSRCTRRSTYKKTYSRQPPCMARASQVQFELEKFSKVALDDLPGDSLLVRRHTYLKDEEENSGKFYKLNTNRICGTVHEGRKRLGTWTTKLMESEYYCLGNDLPPGEKFEKTALRPRLAETPEGELSLLHL